MGKDAANAAGLPISLKVKNTFIDVHSSFVDDGDDAPFFQESTRKRQVSEPTPGFQRQTSGASQWRASDARSSLATANISLAEGEEHDGDELDDSDDREEPETETEPCWFLGRQETEPAWPTAANMGSQVEEQLWGTWGLQPNPGAGDASAQIEPMLVQPAALVPNMWLCQLPAFAEPQGLVASDLSRAAGNLALSAQWPGTGPSPQAPSSAPGGTTAKGLQLSTHVAAPLAAQGVSAPPPEWANTTTVMMRNLPNKYTQHMLLEELNHSGFLGTFDFLYLPIDPETNANRGYAFINFTDPCYAWMLKMSYEGRRMCRFNSDKVVSIAPAALQGFEANYAHYSSARVSRGDPSARPLFLRESALQHTNLRHEGRRRGGRRSQGSLIDLAARQQQQHHQQKTKLVVQLQRPGQGSGCPMTVPGGSTAVAPTMTGNFLGLNGAPPAAAAGAPSRSAGGSETAKRGAARELSLVPQFCPFCGGRCQPQFKFCQFCGTSLNFVPGA